MKTWILAALIILGSSTAHAETDIVGRASVIDGDTIIIRGKRIRLINMDAPETSQLCFRNTKPWRCGQRASFALSDFIGRHVVTCAPTGQDRYRRTLAICYADGIDLGRWMVRNGWAVAYIRYGREYLPDQRKAEQQRKGIWAGKFVKPNEYRRCMRKKQSITSCSKLLRNKPK